VTETEAAPAAPDEPLPTATDTDSAGTAGADYDDNTDADQFPRAYVDRLRRESAGYRERAQRADEYATRLHAALVAATGRLADPTDLPFDAEHLADNEKLTAAIDELLARKPHLATLRPAGDVGQGKRGQADTPASLADMLRANAMGAVVR
jgi:antitoxin component of RelBE/YafQ-DinJ toxin-antitoxin module